MAGTLVIDTLKSSTTGAPTVFKDTAGTEVGQLCRAWVNFNGTTGSIRASFNVSSVTRNGTADYTVAMTSALADINYSIVTGSSGGGNVVSTQNAAGTVTAPTTTSFRLFAITAVADPTYVNIAVFR